MRHKQAWSRRRAEVRAIRALIFAVAGIIATASVHAKEPSRYIGSSIMTKAGVKIPRDNRWAEPTAADFPMYVSGVDGSKVVVHSATDGTKFQLETSEVMELPEAIDYFTQRIQTKPDDGSNYLFRGISRFNHEDVEDEKVLKRVIDDYSAAIQHGRRDAPTFVERSYVYCVLNDHPSALADIEEAVRIQPNDLTILNWRGDLLERVGRYADSTTQYESILKSHTESAETHNSLAWLLASCPDARFRDGKRAVKLALEACELDNWNSPAMLDTLAAAYAESGDFETAVAMQEMAVEDADNAKDMRARLKLYRSGKPYREPLPKK